MPKSSPLPDVTVLVRSKTREVVVSPKSEVIVPWTSFGAPPGRLFKPSRFVIEEDWDSFRVHDLRVGKDSQFPDPRPRFGKDFQPDGPPGFHPYGDGFDTATPGLFVVATVENMRSKPRMLKCHWIGIVVVEGDRPLGPTDDDLFVI